MKIRWTHDSFRLRITPTELAAIAAGDAVGEAIHFSSASVWSASVVPGARATALESDVDGVRILLSAFDVERLAAADAEGVYFTTDDGRLRYLVEKDFPCVHPRAADAAEPVTETFAAPADFEARKS